MLWLFVGLTRVYLLDFFFSSIQFYYAPAMKMVGALSVTPVRSSVHTLHTYVCTSVPTMSALLLEYFL